MQHRTVHALLCVFALERPLEPTPLSLDADTPEPAARAAASQDVVSVDAVPEDVTGEQWRSAALVHGFRSVLAVPITYNEVSHGVLAVYSSETGGFDGPTREILTELGTLVGHALASVTRRNAPGGQQVTELVFEARLPDGDVVAEISERLGERLEIRNISRTGRTTCLLHCWVEDVDRTVVEDLRTSVAVDEVTVVDVGDDGVRFELAVVEDSIVSRALEVGAALNSIVVGRTSCNLAFVIRRNGDHRAVAEQLRTLFPDAELTAKRHIEPSSVALVSSSLRELLTDRQATALEVAYHSGYFDADRKTTGSDIADSLGIAQPTFSNRLRAAQRNLFAAIWDATERP